MTLEAHEDLARRFTVDEEFAGGEGRSYRVRDAERRGTPLLLKVLEPGVDLGEAALLTALRHPRIPRVLEVGRAADGSPFVLRTFVAGQPLSKRAPLAAEQLTAVARELLEVLAFVHLRGVLHLDVKPANVVLGDDGSVHLVDFGMGHAVATAQQARGGTVFFAAPEVWIGGGAGLVGPRSDLFSLGATLAAVARRAPVDLAGFAKRFPAEPFLAAAGIDASALPGALAGFVERLTARDPRDRFADAQDALESLRGGGSGRPHAASLALDPTAAHRDAIDAALQGARPGADLVVTGATDGDRRRVALHVACRLGDVRRIVERDADALVLRRDGAGERTLALGTLTDAQVAAHLHTAVGLDAGPPALAAARFVLARSEHATCESVTAALSRLLESGDIVPDGVRFGWPDAVAGRLDPTAGTPAAPVIDGADALRRAASLGRVAAAEAAFGRLSRARPADEPALRRALAEGLLRCGEPGRALPLTPDLPRLRARALLDLGRTAEAAQELGRLSQTKSRSRGGEADSADAGDDVRRMLAMARHLAGRTAEAIEATESFVEPTAIENRICRGSLLGAAGRLDEARQVLRTALESLPADEAPYLRGVTLINLADAERRAGDLESAFGHLTEAQDLHRRVGHVRYVATAASNVGVVAKDLARYDEARAQLRRARTLFEHVGDRLGAVLADANLGLAQLAAGDARSAIERFDRALPALRELGVGHVERLLLASRAHARASIGDRAGCAEDLAEVGDASADPRVASVVDAARRAVAEPAAPVAAMGTAPATPPSVFAESDAVARSVFRAFLSINRRLASERDLERAMRHLLDAAETIAGARAGYLLVQRGDDARIELGTADGTLGDRAFSRSLANKAISEMRTMTAHDALADRALLEMPSVRQLRVRSAVCVPFRTSAGLTGALYVEHGGRADAFSPRDIELLEALADQAAIAVDRMAREEELATALERSQRDLAVARRGGRQSERAQMIGTSPPMRELRAQIERFGRSGLPVLVLGETGSGKELVARALHDASERRRGPFVSENCSAIPAELIESELFGHVQGAFTGADRDKPGLFELAHGGTLFLDEVGDMPPDMQVKLLRALQEQRIRRVGGSESVQLDVRLVTATHRDLAAMIDAGTFREDLYYRIAAGVVRVPPLRERGDDVVALAEHFLERLRREHGHDVQLGERAAARLCAWRWPGNVRELEHVVARAFLLSDGDELELDELPRESGTTVAEETASWPVLTLDEAIRRTIRAALRHTGGDKTAAAKLLGMSRTALYDRLRRDPELG
ncbi:MAG: sigma 54-interacting transcriptional regulator [Planctomycetes bacterium]|nr:sigma 54-interacting transcriptional regulator [Planctomycetota bacterium]